MSRLREFKMKHQHMSLEEKESCNCDMCKGCNVDKKKRPIPSDKKFVDIKSEPLITPNQKIETKISEIPIQTSQSSSTDSIERINKAQESTLSDVDKGRAMFDASTLSTPDTSNLFNENKAKIYEAESPKIDVPTKKRIIRRKIHGQET